MSASPDSQAGLAEQGRIRPVVDRCFTLAETADAFKYIEEQHARGKVIIRVR